MVRVLVGPGVEHSGGQRGGGLHGGMEHLDPEEANGVECVDTDGEEVFMTDDEFHAALHAENLWEEDGPGFQQLLDAGSEFRFPWVAWGRRSCQSN